MMTDVNKNKGVEKLTLIVYQVSNFLNQSLWPESDIVIEAAIKEWRIILGFGIHTLEPCRVLVIHVRGRDDCLRQVVEGNMSENLSVGDEGRPSSTSRIRPCAAIQSLLERENLGH